MTTPESLALLLSYPDTLPQLRCVVVDEWHELLGNKRGVLLQLNLAVLRDARPALQLGSVGRWAICRRRDVLLPGQPEAPIVQGVRPRNTQRAACRQTPANASHGRGIWAWHSCHACWTR